MPETEVVLDRLCSGYTTVEGLTAGVRRVELRRAGTATAAESSTLATAGELRNVRREAS
jgi:hypothetical protein